MDKTATLRIKSLLFPSSLGCLPSDKALRFSKTLFSSQMASGIMQADNMFSRILEPDKL